VADYTFAALAPTHNVGAFSCGQVDIDDYFHSRAASEQALNLCQVYVMADSASRVWAFGTLSPISVNIDGGILEAVGMARAPYRAIGGYLLGRMGVDKALQNQGIGRSLVARLAKIAAQQRDITGGVFLAVDAKTDSLVSWYQELGFHRLDPKRRRLVLPLESLP
jgi:GNAT superfamily N-acetyltransferase